MKLLKSLILGAVAICAASWGAQAADLPVKAKPVEYVKICSAYGAGFYYIPGTEICLRVGGYLWYDMNLNQRAEAVDILTTNQVNNDYGTLTTRVRGVMIMDARTNTQYGTLRSYLAAGFNWTSCGSLSSTSIAGQTAANGCEQLGYTATGTVGDTMAYAERAFVQFAGWTFGYVGSFFDFSPGYSMTTNNTYSFKWTPAAAYTMQFGNGLSSTLALEEASTRRNQIGGCNGTILSQQAVAPANFNMNNNCSNGLGVPYNLGTGTILIQVGSTGYGGTQAPIPVWNLRVDQAWGSAQVAVAAHELKVNQFLAANGVADKWGWAVNAGIEIKVPWGPGDSLLLQGMWGEGAAEFSGITGNPVTTTPLIARRNQAGVGPVFDTMDSFITAAGQQELVKQWSINGQYRHFWNPMLRTAIFAGFNGQQMGPAANAANFPDLELFQAGLNTIWSPVKDLDLGVEIIYTNVRTVCGGACVPTSFVAGVPRNNTSMDMVSGLFRARRNW